MKLFVGLGNPGKKYANNRHNVGFMALDEIAGLPSFGSWRTKFQGQVCEGNLANEKVVLLKPETFMNLSGQSVGEAARFYKTPVCDVVVFHDEIDLVPGKCRVKQGGGHAGHNGLRSIHQHIGPDYVRVRIGVGHPGNKEQVPAYVLHDFSKADQTWLEPLLHNIGRGADMLASGDNGRFLNVLSAGPKRPKADKGKPAGQKPQKPAPQSPEIMPESDDQKSLLQRLVDKFS